MLTSTPILKIVDPNEDFVVCTNACQEGIGGVLMQNGHVICYDSINIKDNDKNYVTHDLEIFAIVHTINMWRHYLMGKQFELRTDHSGLRYLFEKKNLNGIQIQ